MRFAALTVAVFLAACGQTGALYLPDEGVETPVEIRGPATTAPAPAPETPPPAPVEEEKDKKTGPLPGS
ncbi:MAG TPA: lipoprotein [Steroidobacteraceae bacterium]|nr:lipoprotein [Steroidobacteraceae bacterium]